MKYRLAAAGGDVDLTFNPRQPRDAHGRWTSGGFHSTHTLTDGSVFRTGPNHTIPDYEPPRAKVRAAKVSAALKTTPAAEFLHQTVTPKTAASASNPASDFLHQTPSTPTATPKPRKKPKATLFPAIAPSNSKPLAPIEPDVADVIHNSLPSAEAMAHAQMWWTRHTPPEKESQQIKDELGVKFPDLGVKELRRRATDKKSTPEQRAEYKAELAHRVHLANQGVAAQDAFIARLTERLRNKPEDANIEPLIGETLAAHPRLAGLGPLLHIWDHLRKAGFHVRKEANAEKFVDKSADVAKGVGAVLLAGLLLHLGVYIPGLTGG